MKKVLLAGTALIGALAVANAASAELKLDLGGFHRAYGVYADVDAAPNTREFDFRRDTELYFTGETTLDNGLTIGFHTELDVFTNTTATDEVYAYFSGNWGRVNLGKEDGAAYLLQVAAPSADSNIDGLRQNISATSNAALDYDHADFLGAERITYLTPKFSGFQAGFSYAPQAEINNNNAIRLNNTDNDAAALSPAIALGTGVGLALPALTADYDDLWELAVRWDGEFSGVGISLGAGYSDASVEATTAYGAPLTVAADLGATKLTDGPQTWNIGANLAWNAFSFGGSYSESEQKFQTVADISPTTGAVTVDGDLGVVGGKAKVETWVIGAAWDNGPYHVGVSYLEQEAKTPAINLAYDAADAVTDSYAGTKVEADRLTIGGGYTFGPGLTFRGSVAFGEVANQDFTQVAIGTDIQF